MKITISWKTRDMRTIKKIKRRFGIKEGITVNKLTVTNIKDEDRDLLNLVKNNGFIDILNIPD
jgi:hypothetical protein